jgi:hypothetical protein
MASEVGRARPRGRETVMRRFGFLGVAALVVVTLGLTAVSATEAAASLPGGGLIGPNQVFGALINGSNGSNEPVIIKMACFGPTRPGQTGHPFAGQTVSVFRPEVIRGQFGNTGANGTEIDAFFGPPPPAPVLTNQVVFHHYVTKAMPTTLVLPCFGSSNVVFVPLPMSPGTEKTVTIPVRYVGQP